MDSLISIKDLIFEYDNGETVTRAIDGISLEIERGSFVAVLGHNGSGKSTLARLLNGILTPTSGTILVDGIDTSDEDRIMDVRRCVGMVFQNPDNQIVANVVEDDVAFGPENLGIEPKEIRQRVDEALEAVGMTEYAEHAPHLLSGGQKQRVAIAGVIAMRPRCIVLDEPTAMLDPVGREDVVNTITALNKRYGITVILITHHMNETIGADRLIVMAGGKVVEDGAPREVFTHVENMRRFGLTVPETTALLYELKNAGIDLPLDALSVEECAESIYSELSK
ncbi:MAG: energy-coupling factor transporter ATPase [Oscillospiraceae bacterium]|jgi:energy-coupling factor transport system ATP-binding protein|nr:energy-coupling factor transporter ATPase [Oscillospiraceae bacterium]